MCKDNMTIIRLLPAAYARIILTSLTLTQKLTFTQIRKAIV